MFVGLATFGFLLLAITNVVSVVEHAESSRQDLYINQLNSRIYITSTSVSGTYLYVFVTNNGSVPLWEFNHFAVLVQYCANVSGKPVLSLSLYNFSSNPVAYQWTSLDGLLEPGGIGKLEIVLPYPPYQGTAGIVILSSNYGSSAVWRGIL